MSLFTKCSTWVCVVLAGALVACTHEIKKTDRNIYRDPQPVQATPTITSPLPSAAAVEQPRPLAPHVDILPDTEYKVVKIEPVRPMRPEPVPRIQPDVEVESMCKRISGRLASVDFNECVKLDMQVSEARSVQGSPFLYKRYYAKEESLGKVLILGGTHGDELTSVSIVFKWLQKLDRHHSGLFDWMVAPLVNPDGALGQPATRTNSRGIDLNRNFKTPDWYNESNDYWLGTGKDPRHYPGTTPNSEPETRWVVRIIEEFDPDVIVSVHAPLNLLDFDAPNRDLSPLRIGILKKNLKGTFPGSLGNYAGIQRGVPVLTFELPHSWRMPRGSVVSGLWVDTVHWLKMNIDKAQAQRLLARQQVVARKTQ